MSDMRQGARRKRYGFDFLNTLSQKIGDLSGFVPMCRELVQNADDEGCPWISFEFTPNALVVRNPSTFSDTDWQDIRTIGAEGKREDAEKTGRFGIGFVSVFQICDHPEVRSGCLVMTIFPEDQQTEEAECDEVAGTLFRLAWATETTAVRQGLKKPEIRDEDIPGYCDELEHFNF